MFLFDWLDSDWFGCHIWNCESIELMSLSPLKAKSHSHGPGRVDREMPDVSMESFESRCRKVWFGEGYTANRTFLFACLCMFSQCVYVFFTIVHHFLHAFTESSSLEAAAAGRFNSLEWHIIGAQAWAKQWDMAPRKRFGWHGEVIWILCSFWFGLLCLFCVFPFSAHFLCLHWHWLKGVEKTKPQSSMWNRAV